MPSELYKVLTLQGKHGMMEMYYDFITQFVFKILLQSSQ